MAGPAWCLYASPDWPVPRSTHHRLIEKDQNESLVCVRTGRGRLSDWADRDVRTHGRATRGGGPRAGTTLGSPRTDPLWWSLHDAMLNSIARQVRIRFEIQFHQDAGTVGADGFDAEGELIGNVRNRVSGGDQTEHLVLTIG